MQTQANKHILQTYTLLIKKYRQRAASLAPLNKY